MFLITALSNGNWLNLRRVRAYPRIFLIVSLLVGIAALTHRGLAVKAVNEQAIRDALDEFPSGWTMARPND